MNSASHADNPPETAYQLEVLGWVKSCYQEKFAIPRQSGLVKSAKAELTLVEPYNQPEAVEGLAGFSHVWLSFIFHQNLAAGWQPRVRPPKLGGNKKMGVFATRSPFRPNGLGLSLVKLDKVCTEKGVTLHLSGIDLLDGTPVVDIKPYLPWVDYQPKASGGWAKPDEPLLEVSFSRAANRFLQQLANPVEAQQVQQLISEVLAQNPKPAYQKPDTARVYATRLAGLEMKFRYLDSERLEVSGIFPAD